MIAIKINDHFIIHQLGNTTGGLPVNTQTNIRLAVFIKVVVNNKIGAALKTILNKFLDAWQFIFRYLCHILTELEPILAEVSIEVFRLVIFPFEFLVLYAVLSKLNSIYLCLHSYDQQG